MISISEIERRIIEINEKKTENIKQHEEFINCCNAEIKSLVEQKSLLLKELNVERVEKARRLLYIRMHKKAYSNLIKLAIEDIVSGCKHMCKEFYGAKNYEGYIGQRCDCQYGYGPRHGNISFAIGLDDPKKVLEPDEIEDCLYYLNNFFKIHDDVQCGVTS